MHYVDEQRARANVGKTLRERGWTLFGWKDTVFDPLGGGRAESWDGVATHPDYPGYVLGVKCSGRTKYYNDEYYTDWPTFQATPKGKAWHIEKDGVLVASGTGLSQCIGYSEEQYKKGTVPLAVAIERKLALLVGRQARSAPTLSTTEKSPPSYPDADLYVEWTTRDGLAEPGEPCWTWLFYREKPSDNVLDTLRAYASRYRGAFSNSAKNQKYGCSGGWHIHSRLHVTEILAVSPDAAATYLVNERKMLTPMEVATSVEHNPAQTLTVEVLDAIEKTNPYLGKSLRTLQSSKEKLEADMKKLHQGSDMAYDVAINDGGAAIDRWQARMDALNEKHQLICDAIHAQENDKIEEVELSSEAPNDNLEKPKLHLPPGWSKPEVEALIGVVEDHEAPVLIACSHLGIPTIHDVPKADMIGFGVFVAKNEDYEVSFCGGGAMQHVSDDSHQSYTTVGLKRGTFPYDRAAVLAKLNEWLDPSITHCLWCGTAIEDVWDCPECDYVLCPSCQIGHGHWQEMNPLKHAVNVCEKHRPTEKDETSGKYSVAYEYVPKWLEYLTPTLYANEKSGDKDPIVYLHIFGGSTDYYITEYSAVAPDKTPKLAFGWVDTPANYGGEWEYIHLSELEDYLREWRSGRVAVGNLPLERDLWWTPKRISEVRAQGSSVEEPEPEPAPEPEQAKWTGSLVVAPNQVKVVYTSPGEKSVLLVRSIQHLGDKVYSMGNWVAHQDMGADNWAEIVHEDKVVESDVLIKATIRLASYLGDVVMSPPEIPDWVRELTPLSEVQVGVEPIEVPAPEDPEPGLKWTDRDVTVYHQVWDLWLEGRPKTAEKKVREVAEAGVLEYALTQVRYEETKAAIGKQLRRLERKAKEVA